VREKNAPSWDWLHEFNSGSDVAECRSRPPVRSALLFEKAMKSGRFDGRMAFIEELALAARAQTHRRCRRNDK
jgi:hypothetical protein